MGNRSLIAVGTIVFLVMSGIGYADGPSWRTCQTQAEALCQKGEWSAAFQRCKSGMNLARANYGPLHLNTAKSLEKLGDICMTWGRLEQADQFLNEALRIRSRLHGDCHPSVIKLLTMTADNFRIHRDYDRAETLYREALHQAGKGGWGESSYAALAMEGLARLHLNRGEYASAEPLYQKAIAIYEVGEQYRPAEKLCLATCLLSLADIKRENRDFRKARELYEAALGKYSVASGPLSPMIALTYQRLADLYVARGMPSLALTYYKRALGAHYRTGLPAGPLNEGTVAGLANLLTSQGKLARGQDFSLSAEAIHKRTGGLDRKLAPQALNKE